jgi:ADP-ribosyl-[dinitrogen reductase] hydrolase
MNPSHGTQIDTNVPLRDRFLGCLLGCAVGDALGAPYEGFWSHAIPDEDALMREFAEFEGYPRGQFTDDTQLTLATIRSILKVGDISPSHIARSIADLWMKQTVIGPGGACSHAAWTFLRTGEWQTCGAAIGQASNGTAMRTAALGLFFLTRPRQLPETVAQVSCITHQDSRSIAGGIAVAKAAQLLAVTPDIDAVSFCSEIAEAMSSYEPAFAEMVARLPSLTEQPPDVAVNVIAWSGIDRPEFDAPIITPFVIPTVLAALWCLFRHSDSWTGAVGNAIRLGGDVDTLGAIVGALAGVRLGVSAIPPHLRETVQQAERIQELGLRYHALTER